MILFTDFEGTVNKLTQDKTELLSQKETLEKKLNEFEHEIKRFNEEMESQQNSLNEMTKVSRPYLYYYENNYCMYSAKNEISLIKMFQLF